MNAKANKTGPCSFCGQTKIIQVPEEREQGQISEAVTCECGCEQTQAYAKAKERKDKARKRTDELSGNGAEKPAAEDMANLLIATVDTIEDKHMRGITADVEHGVKVEVSKMVKESIKVERSGNKKTTYEEWRIGGIVLQRIDDDIKATAEKVIQDNEKRKRRMLSENVSAFGRMTYSVINEVLNDSYRNADSEAAREQVQKQMYKSTAYYTPYESIYDVMCGRHQFCDYHNEFITAAAEGLGMLSDSRTKRNTGCSSTTGT